MTPLPRAYRYHAFKWVERSAASDFVPETNWLLIDGLASDKVVRAVVETVDSCLTHTVIITINFAPTMYEFRYCDMLDYNNNVSNAYNSICLKNQLSHV